MDTEFSFFIKHHFIHGVIKISIFDNFGVKLE